ncbi:MAG: hypothetical protein M3041_09490 [Acidobacteriota bacterium]|nr:hypothetical protein [Acidobacteriota bacterium]
MKKIVFGGIAGGLVLFVWSAIAHMPPLGTAGERVVASDRELAILAALGGSMPERAIYILPGTSGAATAAQQQEWATRFARGPAAVVAFNPRPADRAWLGSNFATWICIEFVSDMVAGFVGALIAASLSSGLGFWRRALLMATIGLVATIDIDGSYWNWYGFPTSYLLAQFVDHAGGWFLAGLVFARVRRPG